MTPEAQRIAIAEARGFKNIQKGGYCYIPECHTWGRSKQVPDYLNDLNAMHEAEKARGWHESTGEVGTEADEYFKELLAICCRFPGWPTYCATAAQRAEAFLRTLALWKD